MTSIHNRQGPGQRRIPHRARLTLAAAALPWVVAGCFSYRQAAFLAVRPGADIRLTFAPDAAALITPLLGPGVRAASGQVQEMLGDTAAVVLIDDITTVDGDVLAWRRGRVTLPTRLLQTVEVRTLDRRRTRTFVAAAVVTFTATVIMAIRRAGYSGSGSPTQGGAPPE